MVLRLASSVLPFACDIGKRQARGPSCFVPAFALRRLPGGQKTNRRSYVLKFFLFYFVRACVCVCVCVFCSSPGLLGDWLIRALRLMRLFSPGAQYMRHALWLGTFLAAPCAEDDVLGFLELDAVELDDGGDGTDGALGESTGLDGVMAVVHGVWYEGPRLDGGPRALAVAPFRGEAVRALKALLRMDARDMEVGCHLCLIAERGGAMSEAAWVSLIVCYVAFWWVCGILV